MSLGALVTAGGSLASMFVAAGTAVSGVAAAHPVLAAAVTLGAYELFGGSNNPPHLGNNIDLKV